MTSLDGALARLRSRADGHDVLLSVLDASYVLAELTRLRALARALAPGDEPRLTEHAAPEDWHDERFREGWDCAIAAVQLDATKTHHLPATLATVDDVVGVCAAAQLPMRRDIGIAYRWGDGAQVEVIATDMEVDDEAFVVVHAIAGAWIASFKEGTPSSLLWHAIQAARSAS